MFASHPADWRRWRDALPGRGRPGLHVGLFLLLILPLTLFAQQDLSVALPNGTLKVEAISDRIVRVAFSRDDKFFTRPVIDVVPDAKTAVVTKVSQSADIRTLATSKLKVEVNTKTGAVRFLDLAGKPIAAEIAGSRKIEPAEVQGEKTFHVQQKWAANTDEALYGLGQMQLGAVNIKGLDIDMWQHNTNIVVPLLVSSRGYGIYWQNISMTRFGDLRQFVPIPSENLLDVNGKQGGLTMRLMDGPGEATQSADLMLDYLPQGKPDPAPKNTRWEGFVTAPVAGDYQFQSYYNGELKLWIDGRQIMNHWRQNWLTGTDQVKVRLTAGRHSIKIEWTTEQASTMHLQWKTPAADRSTSLWSEVGDGVDYYFVYGPKLDDVVAGYRQLTGRAAMMPQWIFGLWQSRQRYETAQQSLDVIGEFRRRKIPFDNIVQDWQYWKPDAWGSHEFDPTRFADPDGWIKSIHDQHARLMISVWPKFYPETENAKELQARGFLYQPNLKLQTKDWLGYVSTDYDAFNAEARKLYWSQINQNLFRRGVDAWWMDASEPDITPSPPTIEDQRTHMQPTAMGNASRVLNGFALLNAEAIYTGQRQAAPNQRVFTLTRSGYAGQQRYAASSWSGDISSTWTAMAKQIPAGLGFSISGVPYWTMDTGGFSVPERWSSKEMKPADKEEWGELNTRWFQLSTFTPMLREHGEFPNREMWELGDGSPAYAAHVKFDRLRYRMFPYIYSVAGAVTHRGGSIMRPLVMDFAADTQARDLTDEFMFGQALLVAPVTEYKARSRSVYLPKAAKWYDFWTGEAVAAGTVKADAPYDQIPLFVRAGSIVPFGPELQYIGEKPADPLTLYVYSGTDGSFTLYEDDGLTYDYEKGAFAEIPIKWNDATQMLTLGARKGSFPKMLEQRTVQIVLVSPTKTVGFSFEPKQVKTVKYDGKAVAVVMK
jgi:alpha-D-xyloside xylohydrolase